MRIIIIGILLLAGCAPTHVELSIQGETARFPTSFDLGANQINVFVQPYIGSYHNGHESLNFVENYGILPVSLNVANMFGDPITIKGTQTRLIEREKTVARVAIDHVRVNHAVVENLGYGSVLTGELYEGTAFFQVPPDLKKLDGYRFEFDILLSDGKKHTIQTCLDTDAKTVRLDNGTDSEMMTRNMQ